MKHKKFLLIAFGLLVLLQLAVPLQMIWNREKVLQNGIAVKFKTAPVDPSDPFRGRYINLNYDNSLTRYLSREKWNSGESGFVYFKVNKDGFARIDTVTKDKIPGNPLFIKAKIYPVNYEKGIIRIEYPLNRFYMEESKAPRAEKAYREQTGNDSLPAYALIKILDGDAVIQDVIIGQNSVLELP